MLAVEDKEVKELVLEQVFLQNLKEVKLHSLEDYQNGDVNQSICLIYIFKVKNDIEKLIFHKLLTELKKVD